MRSYMKDVAGCDSSRKWDATGELPPYRDLFELRARDRDSNDRESSVQSSACIVSGPVGSDEQRIRAATDERE